jgi:hypothetical protein
MRTRKPSEIAADLRAYMRRTRVSETDLVRKIRKENPDLELTQSWLSRIASGKYSRITATVRAVAAYASIPITDNSRPSPIGAKIIDRAVAEAWNGSIAQANLIARLIRIAKAFPSNDGELGS